MKEKRENIEFLRQHQTPSVKKGYELYLSCEKTSGDAKVLEMSEKQTNEKEKLQLSRAEEHWKRWLFIVQNGGSNSERLGLFGVDPAVTLRPSS